jgi:cytochrome c biogenesis protein CcmG/thiol:disulfide interchange protein DsbE
MAKKLLVLIALVVTACGGGAQDISDIPELPETNSESFAAHLETLGQPAVVNVWASWCIPCRSEAPLLDEANRIHSAEIAFIGVDVADNQDDARRFLSEFGLEFDHFFDPDREIPSAYNGFGTPITFFFDAGGELVSTHNGVIDERTLALNIDELLATG